MYIITARRMISGDVLKYRNGFLIHRRYETRRADSSQFTLTPPFDDLGGEFEGFLHGLTA